MLIIVKSMRELDFPQLMKVYIEGNLENAEDLWPDESRDRKLFLAEESFREYLQEDFFKTPNASYAIWSESGQYVSALRLEPYRDGLLLEALETFPNLRRKGYAQALLQAVLSQLGNEKLYSHVHKRNIPSLRLHEKMGFQRISEQASYIDGSVNDRCCTFCLDNSNSLIHQQRKA